MQFDAEFRRFSVSRQKAYRFDDFYHLVEGVHCLQSVPFIITYTDPEGDLLPINNDENFAVALSSAQPVLRLHIQQKGVLMMLYPSVGIMCLFCQLCILLFTCCFMILIVFVTFWSGHFF